ncbi:MAG: hypothetical protein M1839_001395 [Geoglossum umbratile]|nr:MAG: hypothetical protein M1839_001395 [Geoglossum umbratile]
MAFNWTYLDAPPDGSLYLVWQPLMQMGTHFASDGYIWTDPEQAYTLEAKGYTVEMYMHRSGYHPPNEAIASHCRRRYRLTASANRVPGAPIPEPSYWIIHYSACEPQYRVPAHQIPMNPRTQHIQNTRRYLQSQGQLVRKEFMLKDKNNWPQISLPGNQMPGAYPQQQGIYLPQQGAIVAQQGRVQQQNAFHSYQQVAQSTPSSAHAVKRRRQTPPSHGPNSSLVAAPGSTPTAVLQDSTIDDEEDTSRGDMLDHLTPREISQMRYIQHHEWMEEVLSSPYSIGQIVPVDLGLGLKGELESLTKGFFEAPMGKTPKGAETPARVGKMEPGKADEFRKRAENKIAEMENEVEKMKRRHAKRMAKLQKGSIIKSAEVRLRDAMVDPTSKGTEIWRLEGQYEVRGDTEDGEGVGVVVYKSKESVDNIVKEVETAMGKNIEPLKPLVCVQKGGLEEKTTNGYPDYSGPNGLLNGGIGDGYIDVGNSAGGLLDQLGVSSTSTPGGGLSTPLALPSHNHGFSSTGTPSAGPTGLTPGSAPYISNIHDHGDRLMPHLSDVDIDVEMSGVLDDHPTGSGEGEAGAALSDWVVVDKAGDTPQSGGAGRASATSQQTAAAMSAGGGHSTGTPGAFANTPGSGIQGFTPSAAGNMATPVSIDGLGHSTVGSGSLDHNHFGDMGDHSLPHLDSAGEALAGYGDHASELRLDDHGGLDMEDSAFGDAFHGTLTHEDGEP